MEEVKKLRLKIANYLDNQQYTQAISDLDLLISNLSVKQTNDVYLLAEIAGSYISTGNEGYILNAVENGLKIFLDKRELFKDLVTENSIDYCIGNAYSALYKIHKASNDQHSPKPVSVKEHLFLAKQSYLKAFKTLNLENLNEFAIQVLTNLGNTLNQSGRTVESLQLFDMVLKFNPEFPQALVSKAENLIYLQSTTNFPKTISLYVSIYTLFQKASENPIANEQIKLVVEKGTQKSYTILKNLNFDFTQLSNELKLNEQEYESHDIKTKFYLDNFFSLTEHGLYCKCNGAKADDLRIGYAGFTTNNKKIIQLELFLNRLKSEFSLSRDLYFDYSFNLTKDNIHYEPLSTDLINGLHHEKLRASFRLCFGILDKIAEGICYLLNLDKKLREPIYFESFWNSNGSSNRWEKINSFDNIHLTALYSIACDLNSKKGEFGFYKSWRNLLEHGIFSLSESDSPDFQILSEDQFSEYAQRRYFEEKTKHLIQLTRSAIFSFVFLTRQELLNNQ